jgi:hypothetical protein
MSEIETAQAVNGWKQAIGIIAKQQKALRWCMDEIERMARSRETTHGVVRSPQKAQEYVEIVQHSFSTADAYLRAMASVLKKP